MDRSRGAMLLWTALALAFACGIGYAAGITYTYDELGRVIAATYPNGSEIVYHYDAAGNRTQTVVSATLVNRPPAAVDDAVTTNEGAVKTFDPRSNDSDPDGNTMTVSHVTNGGHGTVTIGSGSTSVSYMPTGPFYGSDSFVYTISDGHGMSANATVNVTVVEISPTAINDTLSVTENSTTNSFDPRSNDIAPVGDTLKVTAVSTPSKGSVTITGSGTGINYTPTHELFGVDSFTYTITDLNGMTGTGTVAVNIVSDNHAPVAVNDTVTAPANTAFNFNPRTNDSDPDGDAFTITAKSTPSHGTVTIGSGGTSLTYTPVNGYCCTDSYTYTISDPEGATSTATIAMSLTMQQLPPVAVADSISINLNNTMTGTFDPRFNDSDPNYLPFTVTAKTNGTYGTVTIGSGGTSVTYTFTGEVPYNGTVTDTFTYTIKNSLNLTATATVTVKNKHTNNN